MKNNGLLAIIMLLLTPHINLNSMEISNVPQKNTLPQGWKYNEIGGDYTYEVNKTVTYFGQPNNISLIRNDYQKPLYNSQFFYKNKDIFDKKTLDVFVNTMKQKEIKDICVKIFNLDNSSEDLKKIALVKSSPKCNLFQMVIK